MLGGGTGTGRELYSWKTCLAGSEGQTVGSAPHLVKAGGGSLPKSPRQSLPRGSSGSAQMGRQRRFGCTFPSNNNKEESFTSLRQSSPAGCPKPRASRRISNFRNQTGTCLTKINLVPNIYFCHYFPVVEAGRST